MQLSKHPTRFMYLALSLFSLAACNTVLPESTPVANIPVHAPDAEAHSPSVSPNEHSVHWSYDGTSGPEHWGQMKTEYAKCASGSQQSPIDLSDIREAELAPPSINWKPFEGSVINNGHTIQMNATPGSTMILEGKTYALLQLHFHHVSEHTVNGDHYPLEAHFVHQAEDGTLGVFGVFFEEGAANPVLGQIWSVAPEHQDGNEGALSINPIALLPSDRGYYRYQGSLTTPPCSEIVDWVVFSQPLTASTEQLGAFAALFDHNYRPTQPTNRRYILGAQ